MCAKSQSSLARCTGLYEVVVMYEYMYLLACLLTRYSTSEGRLQLSFVDSTEVHRERGFRSRQTGIDIRAVQ